MLGKATLTVPWSNNVPEVFVSALSDELAMSYGTLFARTLSEQDGFVVVTLSDGETKVIGCDAFSGEVTIGRLTKG